MVLSVLATVFPNAAARSPPNESVQSADVSLLFSLSPTRLPLQSLG